MSANELLAHVFGNGRGMVGTFSGSREAAGAKTLDAPLSAFFRYPEEATDALGWLRSEDARGRETYLCAHLLTARRRVKGNAAPLLALYVDGDGAKPGPDMTIPTAVVDSSPGREQFCWPLARLVATEIGVSLNRRLAYAMVSDRGGWALTPLLSSPGTRNSQYPDVPPVALRELSPDSAHDPDELGRLLPPLPSENPRRAPHSRPTDPPGGMVLDDAELIRRATAAANGEKFARLWAGDASGYANGDNEGRSEADLALCSLLAFWCGPDEARIDGLFRRSGLMRSKWDERRYGDGRTYGQGTVGHALAGRSEFWSERASTMSGKVYARRKAVISVG